MTDKPATTPTHTNPRSITIKEKSSQPAKHEISFVQMESREHNFKTISDERNLEAFYSRKCVTNDKKLCKFPERKLFSRFLKSLRVKM